MLVLSVGICAAGWQVYLPVFILNTSQMYYIYEQGYEYE